MEIDEERVDEMVLALLYLTTFKDKPNWRALKSHNWDSLDRLHQRGYISDPATKAKSVLLTEKGAKRSQILTRLPAWLFVVDYFRFVASLDRKRLGTKVSRKTS
jgi:hypothetical protein